MTLTDVNYYTRKLFPFALAGIALFFLFFIVINALLFSRIETPGVQTQQPPSAQYETFFGKITKLKTSSRISYPPNPVFALDTIEGKPITATSSAKVFFLPETPTRFGYVQRISLMAKSLGFDIDVIRHRLDETTATFKDFDKALSVDIATFNFEYKYAYEKTPGLFGNPSIPIETTIMENAKQFLRLANRYPDELSRGTQEVIYLNFNSQTNEFAVVDGPKEANVVEVDFFRPDIDGLPVRPPRYFNSQNFVVMAYPKTGSKVIKAQVKFFEKSDQNFGIYPLKTADAALGQLRAGQGVIVTSGRNTNRISITKLFLVYFDPDIYQHYLQPVYVFLGENGFAAYVPAVEDQYVE